MRRCDECALTVELVPLRAGDVAPDCVCCGHRPDGRLRWSDDGGAEFCDGSPMCAACWRGYRIEHAAHEG